jgi:nitroreductase
MGTVFAIIEKRHSVRNFSKHSLSDGEVARLEALFEKLPKIDAKSGLEWRLKKKTPVGSAKLFAVLAQQSPAGLVEYGFEGQALVLKLVEQGFGTCWLAVGRAVEKNSPAVIVFGKGAGNSLSSKITRAVIRGDRRKPLDELLTHDSVKPTPEQERIIAAMRLAPSAVNKQPWRFSVKDSRGIKVRKLAGHPVWTSIDLGIVLLHGYLAALDLFAKAGVRRIEDDHYLIEF